MHAKSGTPKWPFPLFLLICATAWQITTTQKLVPSYLVPSLFQVATVLIADAPILYRHFLVTISEWAAGLALAILFSLLLCSGAFFSRAVHGFVKPLLVVSQAVPYLIFAPLLLIWLGFGLLPKVVLIVLTCTFPISIVWLESLLSAKRHYAELICVCRLSGRRSFLRVCLPASLPGFFAGLKVSVSYAFVSAVLAELMGSEAGLGVYLARAQSSYRTDRGLACVFVVVLFSLLSTLIVQLIQKKVLFWQRFDSKT